MIISLQGANIDLLCLYIF